MGLFVLWWDKQTFYPFITCKSFFLEVWVMALPCSFCFFQFTLTSFLWKQSLVRSQEKSINELSNFRKAFINQLSFSLLNSNFNSSRTPSHFYYFAHKPDQYYNREDAIHLFIAKYPLRMIQSLLNDDFSNHWERYIKEIQVIKGGLSGKQDFQMLSERDKIWLIQTS